MEFLDPQPDDYTVTKMNIGAFYGTALESILRCRGVTQIFLAGVATGSGAPPSKQKRAIRNASASRR